MKMGQSSSLWWDRSVGYVFTYQLMCLPLCSRKKGWRLSCISWGLTATNMLYPVSCFFLLLLSLLRKPSASGSNGSNQNPKILFSSHSPLCPAEEESLDRAKGVGDKSYSDSLSHACCIKVRRVVGCLISCQNCWSSRPLRSELRGPSSPPHPFFYLSFSFISIYIYLLCFMMG